MVRFDVHKLVVLGGAKRIKPQRSAGKSLRCGMKVIDTAEDTYGLGFGSRMGVNVALIEGALVVGYELKFDARFFHRGRSQGADEMRQQCHYFGFQNEPELPQ